MCSKYKTKWKNGKQYRVHRLVMEQHLGRKLLSFELVHHIDGDVNNNNIENLEIVSRSQHVKEHPYIGVATRFSKKHNLSKKLLLFLYQTEKLSINKIAEKLKVSPMTIWRNLKNYEIRTRSHKEAARTP